jgi:NAD(P)-dependent dehydrogenase (short-subunit alcohol dehydrogenase family)
MTTVVMMNRFVGKTVIVTGGSYGIGKGIANRFAREGARVSIFDIDEERAKSAVDSILDSGGEADFYVVDVSDGSQVSRAINSVNVKRSAVDILVNNAGVRPLHHILELTEDEWKRTIAVNMTAIYNTVRSAAPLMLRLSGPMGGKIINIASISGLLGQNGRSVYGATKAAIMQLTRSLAVELGPCINVNAVAPGYIAGTGMTSEVDKNEEVRTWNIANTPLRRAGSPDDVAGAVAFLASDDAAFITGATLVVDGGFSASKYLVGAGM